MSTKENSFTSRRFDQTWDMARTEKDEVVTKLEEVTIGSFKKEKTSTSILTIPNLGDSRGHSPVDSTSSFPGSLPSTVTNTTDDDLELSGLPIITLQDVSEHYRPDDAWMVIYDKVYNFTNFLSKHPGGYDIMYEYVGYDGTVAFRGTSHSKNAFTLMEPFLIGILPENERIYKDKMKW